MPTVEPQPGKCGSRLTDGSGLYCANGAGKGTDHQGFGQCYKHGGRTANGRKNGARLRGEQQFGELLDECEIEVRGRDHYDCIEDGLTRIGAQVNAWGRKIHELSIDAEFHWEQVKGPAGGVIRYVVVDREGLIGVNHAGDQAIHKAQEQYGIWLDRLMKAAKAAADLGLEQRRVEVEESQYALMERALDSMFKARGEDPTTAKRELAKHLRLIEGAA